MLPVRTVDSIETALDARLNREVFLVPVHSLHLRIGGSG